MNDKTKSSIQGGSSPLLMKYLKLYADRPESKVFAPLAETYRKLGMMDEAFEILKKGLAIFPDYVTAHVILAHCYSDREKFQLAYDTLAPYQTAHLDNIQMQTLFGEMANKIDRKTEALETYKYLLYLNPKNEDFSQKVKSLEQAETLLIEDESTDGPSQGEVSEGINSEWDEETREWIQVDLSKGKKEYDEIIDKDYSHTKKESKEQEDKFVPVDLGHPGFEIKDLSLGNSLKTSLKLEDEGSEPEKKIEEIAEQTSPMLTHTLAELYLQQGLFKKSLEVLYKFLELDPQDELTRNKIEEVKNEMLKSAPVDPFDEAMGADSEESFSLVLTDDDDDDMGDVSPLLVLSDDDDEEELADEESEDDSTSSLEAAPVEETPQIQFPTLDLQEQKTEGHEDLMRAFDEKVVMADETTTPVEQAEVAEQAKEENSGLAEKYNLFLSRIKDRANQQRP